jgi:hypothetical protein
MCRISEKLKLRTCGPSNIGSLENYWVLYKPGNQFECILGEILVPYKLERDLNKVNRRTLLKLLNQGNCFDKELPIEEGDILELTFEVPEITRNLAEEFMRSSFSYWFTFKNGKWKNYQIDLSCWNLIEIKMGEIKVQFGRQSSLQNKRI